MINTVQDYKVRGIPADTLARIRRASAMRGMTQAEYLTALVELHEDMRRQSEPTGAPWNDSIGQLLARHGLEAVVE